MGRDAGWIALGASFSARSVNVCLIPEFKFDLYGEKGVLNYVYERLKSKGRIVIVVAEGAGKINKNFIFKIIRKLLIN